MGQGLDTYQTRETAAALERIALHLMEETITSYQAARQIEQITCGLREVLKTQERRRYAARLKRQVG